MRAGALDRRLVLERATATRDALGGQVLTWSTLAVAWAEQREVRGAERVAAAARGAARMARFAIRWTPTVAGLVTTDRLTLDGAVWQITGVAETARRQTIEITATRED